MFVAPEARDFRGSIVLTLRGGLTVTMIFTDGSLTLSEDTCRRPDWLAARLPSLLRSP